MNQANASPGESSRVASSSPGAEPLLLGIGIVLLLFVGWRWNAAIASWLAPVFLIHFFRSRETWLGTLWAIPLMVGALTIPIHGGWDYPLGIEIAIASLRCLVFLFALYMDRALAGRSGGVLATLVFPAAWVSADYVMALVMPYGSVFSPASTQFALGPLVQLASVTGIWGITFLTGWFASTVNDLWQCDFDAKRARAPVAIFAAVLGVVTLTGALRLSLQPADLETVRIGSIAIPHARNYWDGLDRSNPPEDRVRLADELEAMEDALFQASERAVAAGAQIVFWSEGNAVLYEQAEPALVSRAAAFAREQGIYLAPAMLVLEEGQAYSANKVMLFGPDGNMLFAYEKTMQPFETRSDGVLPVADTPYGRITAGICFDYDFPTFVNQLGRQKVDIALVPSFDTKAIRPYHTEIGLFRAIENGFSMVRHVNEGASMAVDARGRVLAYQDFFATDDATMISDVPTRGRPTLYGRFGDWFAYASALFLVVAAGLRVRGRYSAT